MSRAFRSQRRRRSAGAFFGTVALMAPLAWAQTTVPAPEIEGVEPRVRETVEAKYARVLARPDDAETW